MKKKRRKNNNGILDCKKAATSKASENDDKAQLATTKNAKIKDTDASRSSPRNRKTDSSSLKISQK